MTTKNTKIPTVPSILAEASETFQKRNKTYGDNYKNFGHIMVGLFPTGFHARTVEDWTRLGCVLNAATCLGRYTNSMARQGMGHGDSARDLSVYGAMLEEVSCNE